MLRQDSSRRRPRTAEDAEALEARTQHDKRAAFRASLFPETFRKRSEFSRIMGMPIERVALKRTDMHAYLSLETGVDPDLDPRFFKPSQEAIDIYVRRPIEKLEADERAAVSARKASVDRMAAQSLRPRPRARKSITMTRAHTESDILAPRRRRATKGSPKGRKSFANGSASMTSARSSMTVCASPVSRSSRASFVDVSGADRLGGKPELHRQRGAGATSSEGLAPALAAGEHQLSMALVLHATTMGLEHPHTMQAAKNLRHCLMAQKKTREAQELERHPEQALAKLRKRLEVQHPAKSADPQEDADSLRAMTKQDSFRDSAAGALQDKKLLFERSLVPPAAFATASTHCPDQKAIQKRTIYPRWSEFRAETSLHVNAASFVLRDPVTVDFTYKHADNAKRDHGELDRVAIVRVHGADTQGSPPGAKGSREVSPDDLVAVMPVPEGKQGSVVFRGNQFDEVGTFKAHYLLHGSFFSIGSSEIFEIKHVHVSLKLLDSEIRSGDPVRIAYEASMQHGRLVCDWMGLFAEIEEDEEVSDAAMGVRDGEQVARISSAADPARAILRLPLGPERSGECVIDAAEAMALRPGRYRLRSFFGGASDACVETGASEPFVIRVRETVYRHHRWAIERHVRICILSNPGDLSEDRTVLRQALDDRLEDFRKQYRVQVTVVDLGDFVRPEEMLGGGLDDRARGMSGVEAIFHEIEACRPFNLLVLADRYGWLFRDGVPARLQRMMPWLQEAGSRQRSLLDVAAEFAVETPLAQGDEDDVQAVLLWKCARAEPRHAPLLAKADQDKRRVEADDDENFDGLLRFEDRMWRECGLEAIPYEATEEMVESTVDQLLDELEVLFPEETVPSARRMTLCNMEMAAEHYRRRLEQMPPVLEQAVSAVEAFALHLPDGLPYTLHDLTERQVAMVRKTVRTLGADAESTLRERLADSLFLSEINPSWSRTDSCIPDIWNRGTPLAVVAAPLTGKSTLLAYLLEKLRKDMIPWGALTTSAVELSVRQCFVRKGIRHLLFGFYIGSSSRFRSGAALVSYLVQETLEALGEVDESAARSPQSHSRPAGHHNYYHGHHQTHHHQQQQQQQQQPQAELASLTSVLRKHKARLVIFVDDVDEIGIDWIPRNLDPQMFRLVMSMRPTSAAYQSAKQRLFNYVYIAQAFSPQLLTPQAAASPGKSTHDPVTEMNVVTSSIVRTSIGELGAHRERGAEVLQLTAEKSTWWCHLFERVNPASFKRQLLCDDATIGRFNLVYRAWEMNLFCEIEDLASTTNSGTRDLILDILKRLVKQRPTAGLMLQVLVRAANKSVSERELMRMLEGHRHWNAAHYSVARRFLIETIAECISGRLILRNQWYRELVDDFLQSVNVPRVGQHSHAATGSGKATSPATAAGARQRRASQFALMSTHLGTQSSSP